MIGGDSTKTAIGIGVGLRKSGSAGREKRGSARDGNDALIATATTIVTTETATARIRTDASRLGAYIKTPRSRVFCSGVRRTSKLDPTFKTLLQRASSSCKYAD